MGFGDFLKKGISAPVSMAKKLVNLGTGGLIDPGDDSTFSALLSGIPFVGEGFAQEDSQKFNSAEAMKNRAFQYMMATKKHQFEVDDLNKAGLNPILSAHSGAGVPSGSAASSSPISGGSASANQIRDLMNKTRDQATQNIQKTKEQIKTEQAQQGALSAQKKHFNNSAKKAASEQKVLDQRARTEKVNADYEEKRGHLKRDAQLLESGIGSALNLFKRGPSIPRGRTPAPRTPQKSRGRKGYHKPNDLY